VFVDLDWGLVKSVTIFLRGTPQDVRRCIFRVTRPRLRKSNVSAEETVPVPDPFDSGTSANLRDRSSWSGHIPRPSDRHGLYTN